MFRCPKFHFERSVWTCSNFFSPLQKTSFELKGFKKILHAFWPQGHHHHAIAFKIRNDTKMQMKVQNKKSTTAADEKSCRTAEKRSCCRMYAITLSNHKILTCKKKAFLQFSYLQNETEEVDAPGIVAVQSLGYPRIPFQLPLYTFPVISRSWKKIIS